MSGDRYTKGQGTGAGPSTFSVYASRFLNGNGGNKEEVRSSQIFRAPSPDSPSHDPFLPSPSTTHSHPHLRGGSRSPSPSRSRTPPFPGPGIDSLPDLEEVNKGQGRPPAPIPEGSGSGMGIGLLFGSQQQPHQSRSSINSKDKDKGKSRERERGVSSKSKIPNPYAPSSSESDEDEIEPDLEAIDTMRRSIRATPLPTRSREPISQRAKKGWLAHQSIFPPSSSSSSETDESDKETEEDSDPDVNERVGMMGRSRKVVRSKARQAPSHKTKDEEDEDEIDGYILSPSELEDVKHTRQAGPALDEPLLGPDELDRTRGPTGKVPIRLQVYHGRFGHWEREGLRKYKDSGFLALWLTSIMAVLIGLIFVWGSTDPPSEAPQKSTPSIMPLIPLLLILVIPSLVLPAAFLFLLQKTVRPVLVATAISIPFSLFICGWWAIGASFETTGLDGVESSDRWWGTTGLRICAGLLWVLAAWFGRLVWLRRRRLERTVAVVELSTQLLLTHPPLLLLSPLLLGVFALTSLPFLTMVVRLGMIGYWRHPRDNTWVFHIRPYAGWLIALVSLAWLWTWGVVRGVGKVAVAGVIGEWYFHRDETRSDALEVTTAAIHRATGTSLGSICLGSLIVAIVRFAGRAAAEAKRITSTRSNILPGPLMFISRLTPLFSIVAGLLDQLNGYALVYVGITGDAFWPSARRAVGLAGRRKGGHLLDYTLIKLLLTLSSTAMGLFTATAGYLYMTHSLSNPGSAPYAALLCGAVPFLAIRAGASVLGDAADALFICHQIDRELGGGHCEKAKEAFEGEPIRGMNAA